jgi:predicted ArsR family transcriptional regulator
MVKESYHPNAYLENIKNMKLGLRARTKILIVLEKSAGDAAAVARQSGQPYGVAMHHLRLLSAEGIVDRKGRRPYMWSLTGMGQKRLVNSR